MNKLDKESLRDMLLFLCDIQDKATHYNEQGKEYVTETQRAIVYRNRFINNIISFVDRMIMGASEPFIVEE